MQPAQTTLAETGLAEVFTRVVGNASDYGSEWKLAVVPFLLHWNPFFHWVLYALSCPLAAYYR